MVRALSLSIFSVAISLFVSAAVFFVGSPTAHAVACHVFNAGSAIPTGFAVPYSVVSSPQTLMLTADCSSTNVTLKVGTGSGLQYVYEIGHKWTGTQWQQFSLTGSTKVGGWYVGAGANVQPKPSVGTATYFVGYVCTWSGNQWKCGCRDSTCATPQWQLQAFLPLPEQSGSSSGGSSSGGGSTSSGGGAVQHSQYVPAGYEMTFNDEFTGPLDLGNCESTKKWATFFCKWNVRVLWDNSERAVKTHKEYKGNSNTELGITLHEITPQGTLKLFGKEWPQANKAPFADESYYSEQKWLGGMISSEQSHAQRYGYWEARVKINNVSKGHHIAFWLLGDDGSWPPEIDMLEVANDNNTAENKFFFNSHGGPGGDINWEEMTPSEMDEWHTLGFLWTETQMIWYLDGKEVRKHANYVNNKDFYFLIAPEIGGHWPGLPNGNTQWPMEVEIDYVRVYKKGTGSGSTSSTSSGGSTSSGSTSSGGSTSGSTSSGSSGTGSSSGSARSPHIPAGYTEVFGDEFDTLSLDTNCNGGEKWGTYFCGWNVHHLQGNNDKGYKTDPQTAGVPVLETTNGTLKMRAYNKSVAGFPYVAGMITTQKSHSQTYGYWETRIKINSLTKGHHIAVWLVPTDNSWPPEIDVLEVVDDNGGSEGQWTHNSHGGGPGFKYYQYPQGMNQWHTLGFEWTSSKLTWYVDGKVVHSGNNYINKPMYYMISPEIGGNWPGSPDGSTKWPMEIEFDYVRVYKK